MVVGISQQDVYGGLVQTFGCMEGPKSSESSGRFLLGKDFFAQEFVYFWVGASLRQDAPCMADEPIVLVELIIDKGLIRLFFQIYGNRFTGPVTDFENTAVAPVVGLDYLAVAGLFVVPIDQKHIAIGPILEVDKPGIGIVCKKKVGSVARDIT